MVANVRLLVNTQILHSTKDYPCAVEQLPYKELIGYVPKVLDILMTMVRV